MALTPDVADGASAKAYTFDTLNTLAASGAIHSQWLNNGTPLMTLDKAGKFGIGVTPQAALDIYQAASAITNPTLRIRSGDSNAIIGFVDGSGTIRGTFGSSGGVFQFNNNYANWTAFAHLGVERFRYDANGTYFTNGNVGIGTTTPGARVEADTGSASTVGAIVKGYSGQTADLLQVQGSTGTVRAKFDNNANLTIGTASSIGTLSFTGTGLNDATLGGTYSGAFNQTLRIQITSTGTPDQFSWSIDGTTNWVQSGINITSGAIALNYTGVTVTFGATTGHTLGNYWQATLTAPVGSVSVTNSINIAGIPILWNDNTNANLAIGSNALGSPSNVGRYNTAIGPNAMLHNTTGEHNFALGLNSLNSNTTGAYNVAVGSSSLQANTTGHSNVAIGMLALTANTTGNQNVAIGRQTLPTNTTGSANTFIGDWAGYSLQGGSNNTAVGNQALGASNATANTAIGLSALGDNTSGGQNTALGYNTGRGITIGANNTILGANVTGLPAGLTNNIVLANGTGAIKAQHDGNNWTLTGNVTMTGSATATQYRLSALNTAPASATDTGTTGEIRITAGYIYVCVATNTWVRAALTSW
jgi:hypothetical protein